MERKRASWHEFRFPSLKAIRHRERQIGDVNLRSTVRDSRHLFVDWKNFFGLTWGGVLEGKGSPSGATVHSAPCLARKKTVSLPDFLDLSRSRIRLECWSTIGPVSQLAQSRSELSRVLLSTGVPDRSASPPGWTGRLLRRLNVDQLDSRARVG